MLVLAKEHVQVAPRANLDIPAVRLRKPVTNQVTSPSGNDRHSATHPDTDIVPACGNPTRRDAVRRNRQAWHGMQEVRGSNPWIADGSRINPYLCRHSVGTLRRPLR